MRRKVHLRRALPAILLFVSVAAASPFGDPTAREVGEFPVGVTIGDIDGDGLADLAVANALSGDVSLLLNDGSGPGPEQRIDHGPGDARYVAIEDVDADGDRDLVVLVRAAASKVEFSWSTSLPYLAVRGAFVTAEDVGGLAFDTQFSGNAGVLHDAESTAAGSGFGYLVRPDCVGASWISAGASELAGRDGALP